MITEPCKMVQLMFTKHATIEIEETAGGGAGGIGFSINNHYLYGGGGGAGETLIRKYDVVPNERFTVVVGRGGDSRTGHNGIGGNTYIT